MQYFHNELQGLAIDNYQVGELIPFDPLSQDARQFGGYRCGGYRCGGFRCGGFRCSSCFSCSNCFWGG